MHTFDLSVLSVMAISSRIMSFAPMNTLMRKETALGIKRRKPS